MLPHHSGAGSYYDFTFAEARGCRALIHKPGKIFFASLVKMLRRHELVSTIRGPVSVGGGEPLVKGARSKELKPRQINHYTLAEIVNLYQISFYCSVSIE